MSEPTQDDINGITHTLKIFEECLWMIYNGLKEKDFEKAISGCDAIIDGAQEMKNNIKKAMEEKP